MITLRAPTQLRAVLAFVIAEQIITRPRVSWGRERARSSSKAWRGLSLILGKPTRERGPSSGASGEMDGRESLVARSVSFGICTLAIGNISLAGKFNAILRKARNYHGNQGPLLMPGVLRVCHGNKFHLEFAPNVLCFRVSDNV